MTEHGHHGGGVAGHGRPPARGVGSVTTLPDPRAPDVWAHVVLPDGIKQRLVNHAVFSLLHRERLTATRAALQGLVVLAGPPGTGKTTAARGLGHVVAGVLARRGRTTFIEVDPHTLPGDLLGESQRNVNELLGRFLPEHAARQRFTIVLVDEVEALATSRSAASFEANPVDLHRATDAVLLGLDRLASAWPRVLILATTNFPRAVDHAFLSRADLVVPFDVLDRHLAARVIADSLDELAGNWPSLRALASDRQLSDEVAQLCEGLDGRRIRKVVMTAVTLREATAEDPGKLTADDLVLAANELTLGVTARHPE